MDAQNQPKHTPGPWVAHNEPGHGFWYVDRTEDGCGSIATCYNTCIAYAEANARLIAAAPELLGACQSALRALEDNTEPGPMDEDAKEGLRLAIAKATATNLHRPPPEATAPRGGKRRKIFRASAPLIGRSLDAHGIERERSQNHENTNRPDTGL
jgi:hypothetical protein